MGLLCGVSTQIQSSSLVAQENSTFLKGRSHMRPRMDFHLVLHGEYRVTLKCVKDSFSRKGLLFAKRTFIFAKRTFIMAKTIH